MDRRNIEDIYALTPMQEAMFFVAEREPNSPVYWNHLTARINGDLKPQLFEKAWESLVSRHPVLRTGFTRSQSGQALQIVHKAAKLEWSYQSCDASNPDTAEREFDKLYSTYRNDPPKLLRPPLIRVLLVKTGKSDYRLLWSQHHIILDGWSWPILLREVFETYEDIRLGQQTVDSPAPAYSKYVAWLKHCDTEETQEYWRDYLSGFTEPTRLSTPSSDSDSEADFGFHQTVFSITESDALRNFARSQRVTTNTLIQCAWGLALGIESGNIDVVFGVTLALRPTEIDRVTEMVGMMLATIPMRVTEQPTAPTGDWLRIHQMAFQASTSHAHCPLDEISGCSEIGSNQALFESIVVFENFPFNSSLAGRCESLVVSDIGSQELTNFPMTLTVLPLDNFQFKLSYKLGSLDKVRAERLLARFIHIIKSFSNDACNTVGELERMLPGERSAIEEKLCGPDAVFDSSTLALIADQVKRRSNHPALECGPSQLSYQEMWSRSGKLAGALGASGLGSGKLVGLGLGRSIDMVVAILGVWRSGAAYVPLDPDLPESRIKTILDQSEVSTVISDTATANSFTGFAVNVVGVEELVTSVSVPEHDQPNVDGETAYVMFTSGSTGQPNGVEIPHSAVNNLLESMRRRPGLTEHDRLLAVTTMAFDISVLEMFLPLTCGGTTVVATTDVVQNGELIAATINRERITTLQATPTTWKMLLQSDWQGEPGLKALTGGERLSNHLASVLLPKVGSLWNLYGPTETTIWSTCAEILGHEEVHIGMPVLNTQLRVLDALGRDVPTDVIGELHISGDGLSSGYWKNGRLTTERFVELSDVSRGTRRWFKTADLVSLTASGRLLFHGRSDQQIKLRGYRIEVGDIESHLASAPGVFEVAVTTQRDHGGDNQLVAYVVPDEGQDMEPRRLRDFLRGQLPSYMIPTHFSVIDRLPLTANRKIAYKELPALNPSSGSAEKFVGPSNSIEKQIVDIWSNLLGTDRISVTDNFFELGGHSLLMARLARRLEHTFDANISVADLLDASTVVEQAKLVESARGERDHEIAVADDREQFPLSSIQKRLWFLEQFEDAAGAHNVLAAHRLDADFKISKLQEAFLQLARNHEILRTVFITQDNEPIQRVLGEPVLDWDCETLSTTSELRDRMQSLSKFHFGLCDQPPWFVRVMQVDGEQVVLLNFHHLLVDAVSMHSIWSEVCAFCAATAPSFETATPSLQYGDFALWQMQELAKGAYEPGIRFWQTELAGELPVLRFPSFVPRPPQQTFAGEIVPISLDADLVVQLRELARTSSTTLFSVLLSGFAAVLLRYCRQDELLVGTPVGAIREKTGADTSIGPYINTMALRLKPEADWSFKQLNRYVSEKTVRAIGYADAPFEEIVKTLSLPHDVSRTPVFQTIFAFHQGSEHASARASAEVEAIPASTARTDLSCWLIEDRDTVRMEIEYASDLFERSIVSQFAQHFRDFLALSAVNSDAGWTRTKLVDIPEPAPRRVHSEQSVLTLIRDAVDRYPDRIAVSSSKNEMTYRELWQRVQLVAAGLTTNGVVAGDVVGMSVGRSVQLPLAILGILKSGAAYVPIDTDMPEDRQKHILLDSGMSCIVTDDIAGANLPEFDGAVFDLASLEAVKTLKDSSESSPQSYSKNSLAYVMYTSGSTGMPKGVEVGHRQVVNLLKSFRDLLGINSSDVLAAITTTTFDISVLELLLPISVGARVHVVSQPVSADGKLLDIEIRQSGATFVQGTPATWQMMIDAGWSGEQHLKILCGGDTLPLGLAKSLHSRCYTLWNVFGPTETTVWSSITEIDQQTDTIDVGRPIGNTDIYVLDENLLPVPIGVEGEIIIGGEGVALGYRGQEALSKEKFLPDPWDPTARIYRTGDLGRWLPHMALEHRGRLDDQLKIRGYRIEAGDIEKNLCDAPGVAAVAVVKRTGKQGDDRLVAFVVGEPDSHTDPMQLRRFLRQRLPAYMIPQHFLEIAALPLTANRKVDYRRLPELEVNVLTGTSTKEPRTKNEKLVADIWSDLLGIENINCSDNFIEIGGHSLLTISVIVRIAEASGVNLGPQDLFSRDLAGIAKLLDTNMTSSPPRDQKRLSTALRRFLRLVTSKSNPN